MSRFITLSILLLLGTFMLTNAQTIQQVEYAKSSTHGLLDAKFHNFEANALRKALAEMTLLGKANLEGYTFKKAGKLRDRLEITQTNASNKVVFQLEILESTFLYFINSKELERNQKQKNLPLLTLATSWK